MNQGLFPSFQDGPESAHRRWPGAPLQQGEEGRAILVHRVLALVTQELDLHTILGSSLKTVAQAMDFAAGCVYVTDSLTGLLRLEAQIGLSAPITDRMECLDPEQAYFRAALTGMRTIAGYRRTGDEGMSGPAFHVDRLSYFVATPLMVRGEPLGVLVFMNQRPKSLNPDLMLFFDTLGMCLGVAIENAWLHSHFNGMLEEILLRADRARDLE
jgi:signal transduction protein with GAF and PtsI domain